MDKEKLEKAILQMLDYSQTKDEFMHFLEQENLELYLYRGKLTGVIYKNRKYRFSTLGVPKEQLWNLEKGKKQIKTQSLSQKKQKLSLIKSVASNKYLENHLKEQNKVQQKQWFESIRSQTNQVNIQQSVIMKKKEKKKIIGILLKEAKTVRQLIYFAQKVGFSPYEKRGVVAGFSFHNQDYNFVELGVQEEITRLRALEKQREQKKQAQEKEIRNRNLGVNITLDIGLDFFL
ncbi:MAG: hypothetical protein COB67_10095 [SAR324 cluster bacterium]|uniref:Uncharacterized protein n=1 Tax=SAR324 cluster bacterium TaxID=2024889 RepID=A0A2A4SYR8_9DELT|nr:MAG: hypothetical protein COB67_10095 [SAR324 cluster bacterium]